MSEPAHSIVGRGKSLLDQVLRLAQTRLELLSAELHHEKLALMREWQLAATAVVCICLAGVTCIVLIAVTLSPPARTAVLGAILFLLLGGAVGCGIALRTRAGRAPLFSRVIHQLHLDRAALSEHGRHQTSAGEPR